MATTKRMTKEQEQTWNGLESMELDPEEYYDFDDDEIIDFPPIPSELERQLKGIQRQTRRALSRLEQRLDA